MFNQKLFKKLLKKGIGLRTQKEFAEQTGIAASTITRMLNDEVIPCPRIKTLDVFAQNMTDVTFAELMEACGYEAPKIEDAIKKFESNISDFFDFKDKVVFFENIESVINKLASFLNIKAKNITIKDGDKNAIGNMKDKGAENIAAVSIIWLYNEFQCDTKFNMYYALTTNGRCIVVWADINIYSDKEDNKIQNTYLKRRISMIKSRPVSRLFNIIDAMDENTYMYLPTKYVGTGFEIDEVPEGFLDFLYEHSQTFCDSKENIRLFQKIVQGEDIETILEKYEGEVKGIGVGAVIADIMRKETGKDYIFYEKNMHLPEEERNSCVMCREDDFMIDLIEKNDLLYLYDCAKVLKIEKYGSVVYNTTCVVNTKNIHDTKDFLDI